MYPGGARGDLEALRSALTAAPCQFGEVDIDRIMELGARKRAQRRMGVVGGAMTAVVALTGTVLGVAQLREGPPPRSLSVATPAPSPEFVMATGARDSGGEVVLVLRQGSPSGPVTYELKLGYRDAVGHVTEETTTGPIEAAPGFHALTAGRPGRGLPLYGFYAGPATRITAHVHGLTVTARTEVLPGSDVTVFWFPTRHTGLLDGAPWVPLHAYDTNGHRLGS